jgi:hypothetical protein
VLVVVRDVTGVTVLAVEVVHVTPMDHRRVAAVHVVDVHVPEVDALGAIPGVAGRVGVGGLGGMLLGSCRRGGVAHRVTS